jgi:hypothetical protein
MSGLKAGGRLATMGPVLTRAVCFGCSAGVEIGGVAGTVDWPVVGTFFGALAGTAH